MCAFVRLSFVSAVCEPVKSMLLTVPLTVSDVSAPLNTKRAVPYDAGRRTPPVVVGFVGGDSCEFVMLTMKSSGERFAALSRLFTYCSFVSVEGYALTNSGRLTKSLK